MAFELQDSVPVRGFSRKQDILLSEAMDLVTKNASREELLSFFVTRFKNHSTCINIFIVEAIAPSPTDNEEDWILRGLFQAGINIPRWNNFCNYLKGIKRSKNWIPQLIIQRKDEELLSRIWATEDKNKRIFHDIRRVVDSSKASWISILFLPSPTIAYPYRLVFVTYAGGEFGEEPPKGGEQDWRLLMLLSRNMGRSCRTCINKTLSARTSRIPSPIFFLLMDLPIFTIGNLLAC